MAKNPFATGKGMNAGVKATSVKGKKPMFGTGKGSNPTKVAGGSAGKSMPAMPFAGPAGKGKK